MGRYRTEFVLLHNLILYQDELALELGQHPGKCPIDLVAAHTHWIVSAAAHQPLSRGNVHHVVARTPWVYFVNDFATIPPHWGKHWLSMGCLRHDNDTKKWSCPEDQDNLRGT
jgi:hypothetical protein